MSAPPSSSAVTITATLSDEQAWQVAQFLKRVGFDTCLRHTDGSSDTEQARRIAEGLAIIRSALAGVGVAPR